MVARSSLATMARLTFSCTGASVVATKRVPMLTASAPRASAATSPAPVAMPPPAMSGIRSARAAAGMRTRPGTSSSPGWPAHSNPSMLTASTPIRSAFSACRTEVALWMTVTPAARKAGRWGSGFAPAVSTTFTPLSTIAARYSS